MRGGGDDLPDDDELVRSPASWRPVRPTTGWRAWASRRWPPEPHGGMTIRCHHCRAQIGDPFLPMGWDGFSFSSGSGWGTRWEGNEMETIGPIRYRKSQTQPHRGWQPRLSA